ncbi:MAG: nuclear transport factor 2 family protein [Bacteroidetes bacterium]|nr:nuclear transport factor 2 family protein [Bacteroidota bacterium]
MQNVTSTITNLFASADKRDWNQVQSSFDHLVLIDYASTTGEAPNWQTPKQIRDSWAGMLPGFDKTQHQIFDLEVKEDEASATAQCRGIAEHVLGNETFIVEGVYEATLLKKAAGWVISKFKFNLKDWMGNTQLPVMAMQRCAQREGRSGR